MTVKKIAEIIGHTNPKAISEKENREIIEGESAVLKLEEMISLAPRI